MRLTPMRSTHQPAPRWLGLAVLLVALLTASLSGCAARTVRHTLIKQNLIQVELVREVKGFTVVERDYEHPAIISTQRLGHILGAIEIETSAEGKGTIRQPAFHPDIIPRTAEGLAKALAEANPNEEIGVKVIRREARLGVFNRKLLTTFIAYMDEGHLYLLIRRVEWFIKESDERKPLPEPQRNRKAMNFRVVSGDPIFYAGAQDLEVDWQNNVFRTAFRLPGTTGGKKQQREILSTSPIPKDELEAAAGDSLDLDQITPEQLRALADLEEQRRDGLITETAYQRARRELLRKR
jgi:hypothetical protein